MFGAASCGSSLSTKVKDRAEALDYYTDGKFVNATPTVPPSAGTVVKIIVQMATKDRSASEPDGVIPVEAVTPAMLEALNSQDLHIIKLGHSSLLLKIEGEYWLIDPVFSERASPVSFAGPKRFHEPPITLEQLPPIHRILISHDHYDHLDKTAIIALAEKTAQIWVPLGVEKHLTHWGIDADRVHSFEWWQEVTTDNRLVAFTPAQHFSGRTLGDRNETLWGSWVIKTSSGSLYYSGDGGYFDGFKTIGDQYGPFDLTFIETGAYASNWPDVHLFPEQSVQAHLDLKGRTMMPVHNGTFDLSFHSWTDPLERVTDVAEKRGVTTITPIVGQRLSLENLPATDDWWSAVD